MSTREDRFARMEHRSASGEGARAPKVVINRSQHAGPSRRSPHTEEKWRANEIYRYPVRTPSHPDVISGAYKPDDPLVVFLKGRINEASICRQDLYNFVGSGAGSLFANQNQAYNLEYGLRIRPTITVDCARKWAAILGEQLGFYLQPAENGWWDALTRLREAVIAGRPAEELLALAEAARPTDAQDNGPLPLLTSPGGDD